MSRKGENIYKRKDGRWEARYIKGRTETGKALYAYVYALSYKVAKEKACAARAVDGFSMKEKPKNDSILFSKAAEEWLAYKKNFVKESTYIKYSNLVYKYVLPYIGAMPLSMLNRKVIESLSIQLLVSGSTKKVGLSAKTVTAILSVINAVSKYTGIPGMAVAIHDYNAAIKSSSRNMRVLTISEQQLLIHKLQDSTEPRDLGLLVCLYTGIRIGELCALKWGDISFTEKTLTVNKTMQRIQSNDSSIASKTIISITEPKSKNSNRVIPIPDHLCCRLNTLRRPDNSYVLTGTDTKFVEPRTMENYFRKLLQDCGVPNVNFHCLRHSFATRCIEAGFDVKSLSEILGHASVNITMNLYVHPSFEAKRKNMNRMSEFIAVK